VLAKLNPKDLVGSHLSHTSLLVSGVLLEFLALLRFCCVFLISALMFTCIRLCVCVFVSKFLLFIQTPVILDCRPTALQ